MDTKDKDIAYIFSKIENLINEMIELQNFITQKLIYKNAEDETGKINQRAGSSDDRNS